MFAILAKSLTVRALRPCLGVIALASAAFAPAPQPGIYRLTGMHEAASVMELKADGKFAFALSYGALDEFGEGQWQVSGEQILLTTEPAYREPDFELSDVKAAQVPLKVAIILENGEAMRWPIEVYVTFKGGDTIEGHTRDGEFVIEDPGSGPIESVRLGIAVHGFISDAFPVDMARGNALTFRFLPNSLGQPPFKGQPVEMEGDDLIMLRGNARMIYRRQK